MMQPAVLANGLPLCDFGAVNDGERITGTNSSHHSLVSDNIIHGYVLGFTERGP